MRPVLGDHRLVGRSPEGSWQQAAGRPGLYRLTVEVTVWVLPSPYCTKEVIVTVEAPIGAKKLNPGPETNPGGSGGINMPPRSTGVTSILVV